MQGNFPAVFLSTVSSQQTTGARYRLR